MPTNETKHTSGPWSLSTQLESEHVKALPGICSADGVHVTDVSGYGNTRERDFANARLIAAAPELLGALEWCVAAMSAKPPSLTDEVSEHESYYRQQINAVSDARLAIAKATSH